mmetsp:Transcript_97916/g.146872  ORF Transcript_97916/g.146872 Transcript_97916/m.146872 type:complete len:91 (+) Transcript_97916:326-598(+)
MQRVSELGIPRRRCDPLQSPVLLGVPSSLDAKTYRRRPELPMSSMQARLGSPATRRRQDVGDRKSADTSTKFRDGAAAGIQCFEKCASEM